MKLNNTAKPISNETAVANAGDSRSPRMEFSFSDTEFTEVRAVIKDLTGISMGASKHRLVYRRLQTRLKATGISTVKSYLEFLKKGDPTEQEAFSNAVTTNLTSFFRERHHFDYLAKTIIPEIVAAEGITGRRLRIWSAGCSTGEEPYSIAITLMETLRNLDRWNARILCTDLDSNVIETCKSGVYAEQRVEKMPQNQLRRWFGKSRTESGHEVMVKQELKNLITFKQLNLMHEWPMKGPFDVIFCRNVVIYFDKPTQRVLMERFANILKDDGYLILGHSESLFKVSDRFALLGHTIYRKTR